jgi:hypothetical protein
LLDQRRGKRSFKQGCADHQPDTGVSYDAKARSELSVYDEVCEHGKKLHGDNRPLDSAGEPDSNYLGDSQPQSIPVAMTLSRQTQIPSLPGAFRVFPFGPRRPARSDNDGSDFLQVETDPVVSATDNHVVLVATLADHDTAPHEEIPQAARIDPDQLGKTQVLRRRAIACISLLALGCVVGVAVGIVSSKSKTSDKSPEYQLISFEQFRDARLPADSLLRATSDLLSPQARALQWLEATLEGSTLASWRLLQRYSLAVLYFSLHGEGWLNNTAWLTGMDECSWALDDWPCDVNDRYISLSSVENNVTGAIPPEIGFLTDLEKIDLSENAVSGGVPFPASTSAAA